MPAVADARKQVTGPCLKKKSVTGGGEEGGGVPSVMSGTEHRFCLIGGLEDEHTIPSATSNS